MAFEGFQSYDVSDLLNNLIHKSISESISDILLDEKIVSDIIKDYFKNNHNIDLGRFANNWLYSREFSAGDYIITMKYKFYSDDDTHYDVYIRFFTDKDNDLIIKENTIFSIDSMTAFIHHKVKVLDPKVTYSIFKKSDSDKPMLISYLSLLSHNSTYDYVIGVKLVYNMDDKFDGEGDNK